MTGCTSCSPKWGGVRHWEFDAVRLGEDAEGAPREVMFTIYVDICLARTSCDDVVRAMRARQEPYRSVGWDWLQ